MKFLWLILLVLTFSCQKQEVVKMESKSEAEKKIKKDTNVIHLATDHWPPFYSDKLEGGGILTEIAKEAFKSVGKEMKLTYLPWKRAEKDSADGNYDGLFGCWFSEKRNKVFSFPKPIFESKTHFFTYGSKKVKFSSLTDLKNLRIGTMRGYQYSKDFDNAKFLNKNPVDKHVQMFKMLKTGRTDIFLESKLVTLFKLKIVMPGEVQNFKIVEPALTSGKLFIGFSKKNPRHLELVKNFNEGLEKIKKNGTYKKILEKNRL
jgi:polar amino acid transport system substrate-binding protein